MVTTHSAQHNVIARSLLAELVARLCILATLPLLAAARLAVRLDLPLRPRRLNTMTGRSSSARCDAPTATIDRTQVRSLWATTADSPIPSASGTGVVRLPDAAWPITHHAQTPLHQERRRVVNERVRVFRTHLSHRPSAPEESPWYALAAGSHEARNSHQCEPARDAGRDHRGRPTRRAARRPPRSPADGRGHLPR